MKQYFIFLILILSINFILADTIEETTINIKIHNTTLEFRNSEYLGNNQNVTIVMTNGTINLQEFSFPILFIRNESVDLSVVEKYTECITLKGKCETEKGQFNTAWNNCEKDLADYDLDNNKSIRENLNTCTLEKQSLQINLDAEKEKYSEQEKEIKDNGNSKFIWGGVGFILGIIATLFYQGKIGNQNTDKSHEEFNPSQGV